MAGKEETPFEIPGRVLFEPSTNEFWKSEPVLDKWGGKYRIVLAPIDVELFQYWSPQGEIYVLNNPLANQEIKALKSDRGLISRRLQDFRQLQVHYSNLCLDDNRDAVADSFRNSDIRLQIRLPNTKSVFYSFTNPPLLDDRTVTLVDTLEQLIDGLPAPSGETKSFIENLTSSDFAELLDSLRRNSQSSQVVSAVFSLWTIDAQRRLPLVVLLDNQQLDRYLQDPTEFSVKVQPLIPEDGETRISLN